MFKRILACLMVLLTLVSYLPPMASAEETQPQEETTEVSATQPSEPETVPTEPTAVTEETTAPTQPETAPTEETVGESYALLGANGVVASGECGDNLMWSVDANSTLTISGTGAMWDYWPTSDPSWHTDAPWAAYAPVKLVIEKGITYIGQYAFAGLGLNGSVTLPEGVTSIGDSVFSSCRGLARVTIPESVMSIGDSAFYDCQNLTNIMIPENVTNIESCAFAWCLSLKNILVSERNTAYVSVDGVLFNKDRTSLIAYPAGKESTSYIIPGSVISIGDRSFNGCLRLINVTIPNGVTSIGSYAFSSCHGLPSIIIPESVSSIKSAAFNGCDNLKDVYYTGNRTQWDKIKIESSNEPLLNASLHLDFDSSDSTLRLVSTSPANGETNVGLDSPLVLTFSQDISRQLDWSKGKIYIRNYESDDLAIAIDEETFSNCGGRVEGCRLILPINFRSDRFCASYSGKFYVLADNGVVSSAANWLVKWEGIGQKDTIAFSLKRNIVTSGFRIGEETFQFNNSSDYFGSYFNIKLLPAHEAQLMRKLNGWEQLIIYCKWASDNLAVNFAGNCFGMAALMGLFHTNKLSLDGMQSGTQRVFNIDYPKSNSNVRSYLSYYQLLQCIVMPSGWDKSNKENQNRKMVNALLAGGSPVMLAVTVNGDNGKPGGHEILAYAIDADISPNYYVVYVADPNGLMVPHSPDGCSTPQGLRPGYYAIFISKDNFSYVGAVRPATNGNTSCSYLASIDYVTDDLSVFDPYSIQSDETYIARKSSSLLGTQSRNFSFVNKRTGEAVIVQNGNVIKGSELRGPYSEAWGSDPSGMNYYCFDGSDDWEFVPQEVKKQFTIVGFAQADKGMAANTDARSILFTQSGKVELSEAKSETTLYITPSTQATEDIAICITATVRDLAFAPDAAGNYTAESPEKLGEITITKVTGLDQSTEKTETVLEDKITIITDSNNQIRILGDSPSLVLDREYITLNAGAEPAQLQALPEYISEVVVWSAENPDGIQVIDVSNDGCVTPLNPGTAYVVATLDTGEEILTARCRVDVTGKELDKEVLGVDLGTKRVTTELYSTDYAKIDILPRLKQNEIALFSFFSAVPKDNGVAITGAYLEDENARQFFDLRVKDDRQLLLVPTQEALDNAKGVKSSYSSKIVVLVNGVEYHTDDAVTISVKKTMPKLKAANLTFNPFYTEESQTLTITGGTVTKVEGTTPDWLTMDGTKLTLSNAPKSGRASLNLLVYTTEWAIPVNVKASVKLSYKAPRLKLSASSVTLSETDSLGVTLKLTAGKQSLEELNVKSVTLPAGFEDTELNLYTGEIALVPIGEIPTGKQAVRVSFYGTDSVLDLPLRVNKRTPTLRLSKTSVSLNAELGDSMTLKVTATPADLDLAKVTVTNPSEALEVSPVNENGEFTVTVKQGSASKASYALMVQAPTGKAAKLTVKTLAAGQKVTMSLKAAGSIDLTFPEKGVALQPKYRNYAGELENVVYTLALKQGKVTLDAAFDDYLTVGEDGLIRWNGTGSLESGNVCLITMMGELPNGTMLFATAQVRVTETPVILRLSKASLSLNKRLEEKTQVMVTTSTRGYTLGDVELLVTDNKNVPSDGLTAAYENGLLTLSVNEKTVYGGSYKVQLWVTPKRVTTLMVRIPAEKKSAVTMTARARGGIDVIRDASEVIVTPTYRNCLDGASLKKQVKVTWAQDGRNYSQDVTEDFILTWAQDGTLHVSKVPGKELALTGKYRLEILCEGMEKEAYTALSVKCGTARFTVASVSLYAKDANDMARLTITTTDKTVNTPERVELKDARLKGTYEVLDLGGGQFALCLIPGAKAKTGTVTLNLFCEGNTTAKPSGTVSVKVEIR